MAVLITRKPIWRATAVPLAKIKSTTCDFLLIVSSNHSHITCRLRNIFNPNFNHFWLIHTCDGRTDRRAIAYSELCIMFSFLHTDSRPTWYILLRDGYNIRGCRWKFSARGLDMAIWNFSKMAAAAAILDLFEPEIAPLDPPSPKTPP